jgi:hypothetical protein
MIIVNNEQICDIYDKNKEIIERLKNENRYLHIKYIFLTYGIKIGDIVRYTRNKKLYKIVEFNFNYKIEDYPCIYGLLQKKNGENGVEHNLLQDWEKVE